ncbi:hypothetical protein LTS10_012917 [Elasticomyces elasticus]|nr:hypothetical protein LTS10_012917 [Elasticomyces elasticus]
MSRDYAPGIPARVREYADTVKQKFTDNATQPGIHQRLQETSELPVLPSGISRKTFNAAIQELRGLVDGHVEIHDGPLDDGWYLHRPLTHDAYPLQERRCVSSAVCAPGSVAQTQAVVKWANKWLIPILALSLGRNLGYGGSGARVEGCVIVDMGRRMDRVLELNEESAFCLVEPGVSYYKLYDAIKKSGKKLWVDVPDLGGGSVLGNALDRGVGYTPYGGKFSTSR